jgi:hypothetical protein
MKRASNLLGLTKKVGFYDETGYVSYIAFIKTLTECVDALITSGIGKKGYSHKIRETLLYFRRKTSTGIFNRLSIRLGINDAVFLNGKKLKLTIEAERKLVQLCAEIDDEINKQQKDREKS